MENLVYSDLLEQYKNLNEEEVKSLLIYKSQLFNLINSVSSIDNFLELSDEFIVKLLDDKIFLECENFGKIINKPENVFLKFSTFRGINFSDPTSLVATAKKVYSDLESAMSKIKLSNDLTVYRVVSMKDGDKLETIARGDLVSTSIDMDEALKFIDNKSKNIFVYEIKLEKGTPVLVTPYSLLNEYKSEADMVLKTDNYNLGLHKTVNQGQKEVLFSKKNLELEIVDSKNREIDGSLVTFYKVNTKVKKDYKFNK